MEYMTISGEFQATYEILRSIFICSIKGVESFEEGMEFIKTISKKYSDATHNCYAITAKSGEQKFSDANEPQGTAGMPILQVLKKRNITNVAAVVTRYFGGVKLGAGGLISAYTESVAAGIDKAKIVTKVKSLVGVITLEYAEYSLGNTFLLNNGFIILDSIYSDSVVLEFASPLKYKEIIEEKFREITLGKKDIDWIRQEYFVYN